MSQVQAQTKSKTPPEPQQNMQKKQAQNPSLDNKQNPITQAQQIPQVQPAQEPEIKVIDDIDPQMRAYFQQKSTLNTRHKSMAIDLTDQKTSIMKECIKQGFVNISEVRLTIGDIISRTSPMAKEEHKLNEFLQQKNELESELRKMEEMIKYSNGQTRSNSMSPRKKEFDPQSPISPQQHKRFVERITKMRKQNEQKRKMNLEYQQNRLKQLQKKQEQAEMEKQEKQTIQKRNYLQERLEKIVKRRQKMKEQELQSKKRFKSVCQQKRRHEIMEESYQKNILLPSIEEKNKFLEERSKQINTIKIQEIKIYEQQYLKNKQERQEKSRKRQTNNWHYKPPPYSSRIIRILEEEQIEEKIRQEEEKRKMEELRLRQDNYKQYLKDRLSLVKIDEKKRLEMSTLISKQKSSKDGLSQTSMKELGNKYLGQIKSKIKMVSKDKKESLSTNQQSKVAKIGETYKIKSSTSMGNYSSNRTDINAKNINSIVSSSSTKNEKMEKLKMEVEKMTEKTQRKSQLVKHTKKEKQDDEDIDNLLNSIKAKVSIIELYKK